MTYKYKRLPEVEAPEKGDAVTEIIRALSYTWQDASLTEDEADWDDYVVTLILNLQKRWDEKRIRKCIKDFKPYVAYRKDAEHRKDDW
jgi:hypothetical protein